MSEYAGIYLLDTPYCIDTAFDYYIPPDLRRDILCGDFVTVPFGTSNRPKIGVVAALKSAPEDKRLECKPILSILDKSSSLSAEALGLCSFLKEQTLCTFGDAVRAMVPTSALTRLEEVYEWCGDSNFESADLTGAEALICDYIIKKGSVSLSFLKTKYGSSAQSIVKKLLASEHIRRSFAPKTAAPKTEEYCALSVCAERILNILEGSDSIKLRSEKQIDILRFLYGREDAVKVSELLKESGATRTQLNALLSKELIRIERREVDRGAFILSDEQSCSPIELNEEQTAAFETLCALADSHQPRAALLHGVTGSGKTSVMMKLIDRVLSDGRTAIVLLPEIALTPQTLNIFCSRYGKRVAVIHSGLSAGERLDTHKRIKEGGADLVIGTRSAVFAPLVKLGLIIIDEEQEHTYKSDMNPKYHTRDVARYRCAHNGALMLLASATPSFESYKKALDGKYTLVELKHRYGSAVLPTAELIDMRNELQAGNVSPLSSKLCEHLLKNKANNDQSILFINRRGYNNFISCRSCGEALKCPDCSVSLTYHTNSSDYESGYLACHWCGKRMPLPKVCPSCQGEHLARMGYGTQRVEQELGELLHDADILRMDTDTTTEKSAYEELLSKFRRHEADVLLGTQMVTKGHDFPDVTLVGVLLADASLYLDDYRAAERTFAMLTQVIGRAGRSNKAGKALIQTNNPDNECIRLACAQDYRAFFDSEIRIRKLLVFPPFCDIALLTLTSRDEKELAQASRLLSEKLTKLMKGKYSDLPLMVWGPFEAPVYKVENKYRMRMVIKCKNNRRCREMLSEILKYFSGSGAKGLSLSVDINPSNL